MSRQYQYCKFQDIFNDTDGEYNITHDIRYNRIMYFCCQYPSSAGTVTMHDHESVGVYKIRQRGEMENTKGG